METTINWLHVDMTINTSKSRVKLNTICIAETVSLIGSRYTDNMYNYWHCFTDRITIYWQYVLLTLFHWSDHNMLTICIVDTASLIGSWYTHFSVGAIITWMTWTIRRQDCCKLFMASLTNLNLRNTTGRLVFTKLSTPAAQFWVMLNL